MLIDHSDISQGSSVATSEIAHCVSAATSTRPLDPSILFAVIKAENGNKGMVRANTNNSFDLGVAQINTIQFRDQWFNDRYGNDWRPLANDVCMSIGAAADILLRRMSELPVGASVWEAVGHYNSKTKSVKVQYLRRVMSIYTQHAIKNGGSYRPAQVITFDQKHWFDK